MNLAQQFKTNKKLQNWTLLIYYALISVLLFFILSKNGYLYLGDDIQFHVNRIEELAANLKLHNLFVFLSTFSTNRIGIATNLFYPGLWLYPFAFLRLIIPNPIHAIYLGLMLINLLTCVIAHFTFRSFSGSAKQAFIFTNLYFFSSYRLIDIFNRFDLAEFIALSVIPLVFWGFYETLFRNMQMWPWLAVGMALLLYAHILSFIIVTCFLGILTVVNFKKISLLKQRGIKLLFSILAFLGLTAGFLYSFITTYLAVPIQTPRPFILAQTALNPKDLFGSSFSNQIFGSSPTFNLGFVALVIGIFTLLYFSNLTDMDRQIAFWSVLCIFFSTKLFPWQLLQNTGVSMIQFPWRIFIIANFLICVLGTKALSFIKVPYVESLIVISLILLSVGAISQFVTSKKQDPTLNRAFSPNEPLAFRYHIKINQQAYKYLLMIIPTKDYIPINPNHSNLQNRRTYNAVITRHMFIHNQLRTIHHLKSFPNGVILTTPKIGKKTTVSLPFYLYQSRHYRVWVNGKLAKFSHDKFRLLKLELAGNKNVVKIQYVPTLSQWASILISIISFISLIYYGVLQWRRK
ncbi:hypothetical protein ACLJJ6_08565 [Pediococcus siamensis]|uniref:hypothetical protein n=1 Tax=Pediococcus siamensis TaxID=381829 RepID=UPI0039A39C56